MTQPIDVRLIGFGEAAMAFAGDRQPGGPAWAARAYDIKTDDPALRAAKLADYAAFGVNGVADLATALAGGAGSLAGGAKSLAGGAIVLALVTAGQAVAAARAAARCLPPGALYLDMNSVAPATKRAAAAAITAAGGRYVDVAVMAPVHPAGRAVPLLLSGPDADAAVLALTALGFGNVGIAGSAIGQASAIKMIRSVMVKGMEALAAECALAATRAGVLDQVLGSLGPQWPADVAYRLERMTSHGSRRAEEMAEVAATLLALGVPPAMASATQGWQARVGGLGLPASLTCDARLAAIDTALALRQDAA